MSIDISPIVELDLRKAFKDEKAISSIKEDEDFLKILFQYSNKANIFVVDDAKFGYSCFISDTKGLGRDKTLCLENHNHFDIFLMRIDGLLFNKKSKCDCAIICQKVFCFVEFKTNASNLTYNTRENQYHKCIEQLRLTVQEFDKHYHDIGEDFRKKMRELQAIAVFNPTVPSDSASTKRLSAIFAKEMKMVLKFTNRIKFIKYDSLQ